MNDSPSCPDEATIHAYVDGRLDEATRAHMEAWLDRHPDRAVEIRRWQRDAQQLRAAFGGLTGWSAAETLDPARIRVRHRHQLRARIALAAGLLLALVVGGAGGWQARGFSVATTAPAPMADALQAYRMFALRPHMQFDATQQHPGELQAWLDRHFRNAAPLPDLGVTGFRPVGGRLLATESGPAAMVLYEDGQGRAISFYIRPPSPRGALPHGERRDGRLATAYWSGNGYNYALVSRADAPDMRVIREASLQSSI